MLWIKSCKRDINLISGPTERKRLSKFKHVFLCNKTSRIIDWSSWDLQRLGFFPIFISFYFSYKCPGAGAVYYVPAQAQPGLLPGFLVTFGFVVPDMGRTGRNMGMCVGDTESWICSRRPGMIPIFLVAFPREGKEKTTGQG